MTEDNSEAILANAPVAAHGYSSYQRWSVMTSPTRMTLPRRRMPCSSKIWPRSW